MECVIGNFPLLISRLFLGELSFLRLAGTKIDNESMTEHS